MRRDGLFGDALGVGGGGTRADVKVVGSVSYALVFLLDRV